MQSKPAKYFAVQAGTRITFDLDGKARKTSHKDYPRVRHGNDHLSPKIDVSK